MPDSNALSDSVILRTAEAVAQMGVSGYGGVAFQVSGTFSGTLTFEATVHGSEWVPFSVTKPDSTTRVTTATAAGVFVGSTVGFTAVRARMSTYSTGGASVMIRADVASPGGGGGGGGAGTDVNLVSVNGSTVSLGQAAMAASFPVVIASDQTAIPITGSISATNPSVSATGSAVPASATYVGVLDGSGNLTGLAATKLDYDTGAGTVGQTVMGIALPASGGPVAAVGGSGVVTTGTQRVTLATDVALPTGANVIGHVITDSGSVVAGTGTAGTAATGVVTVQGIASMTKLLVTPDANSAINLAQVGGTNTVNGGVAGSQSVGGTVATNAAITANPLNLGAQAVSSENAAVTTARQVQLVADLVGKLIVLPYANPENFVSGAITSAMTGTTSTSCVAAPASGLRNYITQITVSNASITVPTDILIQDGSGGTTLYVIPCPAGTGTGTGAAGATLTFPTPLRQPTTATAIYVANVTTGSSTKVSISGYKGA